MALNINTNIGALGAAAAATSVNKSMETAMERLSTGLRINTAADDAAGVAIASRLTSEIRGTNMAIRNASDAQAMIDTAEGAHIEITNILQRMRELAVQSANDTNSADDRANLALEMTALTAEISHISANTSWAGKKVIDGTVGATGSGATLKSNFTYQIGSAASDTMAVAIQSMTTASLSLSATTGVTVANSGTTAIAAAGATTAFANTATSSTVTVAGTIATGDVLSASFEGRTFTYTATANDGFERDVDGFVMGLKRVIENANVEGISVSYTSAGKITITKGGSLSINSATNAATTIGTIDNAIGKVNSSRAELGAYSNRIDSAIANMTNISTNLEAGRSRIQDADFAAESTALARSQILQQASMAMLAQANASKQSVLSLLQG
jgi:flagellin